MVHGVTMRGHTTGMAFKTQVSDQGALVGKHCNACRVKGQQESGRAGTTITDVGAVND